MLPSKMVQMRFTPSRGFKNQNGSTSQNNYSRSHTPSARNDNGSPDAQPSFISSSMSLFGADDDLDEPFTGRNHFALYMERIARESHGHQSSSTSGSSPELFVRSISAPMTTPQKTMKTSDKFGASTTRRENDDEGEYTNGSATFSEESVTLQTVQETISVRKTAAMGNKSKDEISPHSPVVFQLNRPLSPERMLVEEESKFETKVSSIVGLEASIVQTEDLKIANKLSGQKSPNIAGLNLNGENLSLEVEEKNEIARTPVMVVRAAASTTTNIHDNDVLVAAKSPSTDSGGSRRTSLGSDESRSTPRTRRRKQQLVQHKQPLWSMLKANKIRFFVTFVVTFAFIEVFNLWWLLVSIYSPKETLERDLKEIIFWFIFSCLLILFFVFFRR